MNSAAGFSEMSGARPILGMSQRQPPQNVAAEQALLGALLTNNKAYERVSEFLRAHHFYDPVNGLVYGAIARRIDQGQLADPISLKAEFDGAGTLGDVSTAAYLAQLVSAMVGVFNAGEYGRAIHDAWLRRELAALGEEAVERAFGAQPGEAATDIVEQIDARLTAIADGAGELAPPVQLGEAVHGAIEIAEAAARRGDGLAGISTGYPALDRMTKGLMASDLFLIGARPAMGKTALGMAIAVRAAAAGSRVLYWCGEMTAEQLGARVAAAGARLPTTAVFSGRTLPQPVDDEGVPDAPRELTGEEWARLARAETAAARLPLLLDCRPGVTVAALRARARRLKRSGRLDLLVVDYVQLMRCSEATRRASRYEQITEISGDLLALAKELGSPVLALAQINRENEKRTNKRPTKSDLRDSGALEQDATRIAFLHRPHYYLTQSGPPERGPKDRDEQYAAEVEAYWNAVKRTKGVAEIIIDKNRHGPTGITRLRFEGETTWFFDETELDTAPAWSGLWGG